MVREYNIASGMPGQRQHGFERLVGLAFQLKDVHRVYDAAEATIKGHPQSPIFFENLIHDGYKVSALEQEAELLLARESSQESR